MPPFPPNSDSSIYTSLNLYLHNYTAHFTSPPEGSAIRCGLTVKASCDAQRQHDLSLCNLNCGQFSDYNLYLGCLQGCPHHVQEMWTACVGCPSGASCKSDIGLSSKLFSEGGLSGHTYCCPDGQVPCHGNCVASHCGDNEKFDPYSCQCKCGGQVCPAEKTCAHLPSGAYNCQCPTGWVTCGDHCCDPDRCLSCGVGPGGVPACVSTGHRIQNPTTLEEGCCPNSDDVLCHGACFPKDSSCKPNGGACGPGLALCAINSTGCCPRVDQTCCYDAAGTAKDCCDPGETCCSFGHCAPKDSMCCPDFSNFCPPDDVMRKDQTECCHGACSRPGHCGK